MFVDGKRVGTGANPEDVYGKIERLIRDNPSGFDISSLSGVELSYVEAAMSRISSQHVKRILSSDPVSGLDMDKVFVHESFGGSNVPSFGL